MRYIKSIILTMLTALFALPASATSTVVLATPEELEAAGLTSSGSNIPGGTVIFDNDIATFSLAYDDEWSTDADYGIHSQPHCAYRLRVGDSPEFTIGVSPAGQTNPEFSGYENGVMSTGSVFKLDAKQTGWITVFTILFNADKKYVVFENENKGVPYTLGGSDGEYIINYCQPMISSGEDAGYIDLTGPNTDRYFETLANGNHRPQSPYITVGMESVPGYGMGYLTFKVKAGNSYYVSGLGTRLLCQGYVFSDDAEEPTVTYLATDDLPEVTFHTRANMPKMVGENFEYDGIVYTVMDAEQKTVKTRDGSYDSDTDSDIPGNTISGAVTIPSEVSDGIDQYTVIHIGDFAFSNSTELTSITLPESVKTIGEHAFSHCTGLTSVSLSEMIDCIESGLFYDCTSLEAIQLPSSITTINNIAFAKCAELKEINIPEAVTYIGEQAFFECTSLPSIELPDNLQMLGASAFYGCSALNSIIIPESISEISYQTFRGCSSLSSITLPLSLRTIGDYAFYGCSPDVVVSSEAVEAVPADENIFSAESYEQGTLNMPNSHLIIIQNTIPWNKFQRINASDGSVVPDLAAGDDFEYEGIWYTIIDTEAKTVKTKDGYAGVSEHHPGNTCEGDLIIPSKVSYGMDEYTVVGIGDFGFNNNAITTLTLPETIDSFGQFAFFWCTELTTVNFPDNLKRIGIYAFENCEKLTTCRLPESLEVIDQNAFDGCAGLTDLEFPNTLVTIGKDAFRYCNGLVNVNLPESLTSIGWSAFRSCENLTSINLPASLTTIEDSAFAECTLETITYNASSPVTSSDNIFDETVYENATLNMPNASRNVIEGVTPWNLFKNVIPGESNELVVGDDFEYEGIWYTVVSANAMTVKTKEGDWNDGNAIPGNTVSGDLEIPSTVSYGGIDYTVEEIGEFGFCNNTELTSISLPESIKYCSTSAFQNCTGLTKAKFTSLDDLCRIIFRSSDANPLDYAHHLYFGDEEVTEIVIPESLTEIRYYTFVGGSGLTSVTLHDGLTSIGGAAFSGCTGLTSIILPTSLTSIKASTFSNCTGLTSIVIPETISIIEELAFDGCTGLTSVTLPSSLTSLEMQAFARCSSLSSIIIPEGVTSIGRNAFIECAGLTSVTIPASVTSIGNYSFYLCDGLTSVTYNATTPIAAEENIFTSSNNAVFNNATLNMPNATLADVQATEPWSNFKTIIAKDGSVGFGHKEGDSFEYEGLWYNIIDAEAKTVMTMPSTGEFGGESYVPGNNVTGDIVIPSIVSDGVDNYTVVEIGSRGFMGLGITSVSLPESVLVVRQSAFSECKELVSVSLPNTLLIIQASAFSQCTSLVSIDLPDSLIQLSEEAFGGCTSLKEISIPEGITEVSYMAFNYCPSLISVHLPQTLTVVGVNAFQSCSSLASIDWPLSLQSVDGGAFNMCGFTSLNLPEGLEYIGPWAFQGNPLTSVTIPSNLKKTDEDPFNTCFEINEVNYLAIEPVAFRETLFPETIYSSATLNMQNATLADIQATVPWNKFKHIVAKDGSVEPGLENGEDFVYNGMTYTIIDAEAKTCKTKDNWYNESEGVNDEMFTADFEIPSTVTLDGNEYTVVEIGNSTFTSCLALTAIKLPSTIKKIGQYAFDSSGLNSVVIPEGVDTLKWAAFRYCKDLSSVQLPSTLTTIEAEVFMQDKQLASISLPEGLISIGEVAFLECDALTEVSIPASVVSIGERAFASDFNVTQISLKEGLKEIEARAFWGCELTTLTLPASLTSIGSAAFDRNQNIAEVTYNATEPITAPEDIFDTETANIYATATLNMPNATLEAVQSTVPWNKFLRISASDGSIEPSGGLAAGEDFEYEGIWYTVLDADAKTVKTKDGDMGGEVWSPGTQIEGSLTIPSTVSDGNVNYTVTELGNSSFTGCNITSVTLPETLTSLGLWTFNNCENLTSINIPASVSKIGWGMFTNCRSLASIDIPDNIQEIEGWAFNGCSALTSVRIPASQTVLEENVFANCSSLASITLPETLTEMKNGVFNGCSSLQSISLPSTLTSIGEIAFSNCSGITSVTLPESLKSLGGSAFLGCSNLVSVVIPAGIEGIGENAFAYCNSVMGLTYNAVTPITAPDICNEELYTTAALKTPNATLEAVQAVSPWNKFQRITASDGSIGEPLKAGEDFVYEGLVYTVLDAEAMTCKTKDGSEQGSYVGENSVPGNIVEGNLVIPATVYGGNNEYTVVDLGQYGFANNTGLISVVIPETVTKISSCAFMGSTALESVTFPSTLKEIADHVFSGCTSLKGVILPDSLTRLGYSAFRTCSSITSIVIPESLTFLENQIFGNCYSLNKIDLPATLTEIDKDAFWNCAEDAEVIYRATTPIEGPETTFNSITYQKGTLITPNATLESVQATVPWNKFKRIEASDGSVGFVNDGDEFEFEGLLYTVISVEEKTVKTKEGLRESDGTMISAGNTAEGALVIPEKVAYSDIEFTVVEIGDTGFSGNKGITSVILPSSIERIGLGAFELCSAMESISLPDSLKVIDQYAFWACYALKSISIPASVSMIDWMTFFRCESLAKVELSEGLLEIGPDAFRECAALNSITLPASLTFISTDAFRDCENLVDVTYLAAKPISAEAGVFMETVYDKATLNTPNATLADVQATLPWNMFKRIVALDGYIGMLHKGDDFEAGGIIYTVTDEEDRTLQTKSGAATEGISGNKAEGNIEIPATVTAFDQEYTVTEIGDYGFGGNSELLSVIIPPTVRVFGTDAFADCERLTSIIWKGQSPLPGNVVDGIGNPNLLVYVDSIGFAPEGLDHNIVVGSRSENIVLTPGYPFLPLYAFVAEHSEITKSFTQQTPLEGCAGWETLTIPFVPESITAYDGRKLVPFAAMPDLDTECPFWLYEADATSEWKEAAVIRQGVPYLISMPNNDAYDEQYRIDGEVTFSSDSPTEIYSDLCSPYAVTWNSGREFRSLWLPLDAAEAANAMGLNVGINDLTNDEGELLAPGSAFHADVLPLPMEAYVTRIDGRRAMPVRGGQSFVGMLSSEDGLRIGVDRGVIVISSDSDRFVDVVTMDGITLRHEEVKAGVNYRIEDLTRGIYIVAGRKITVR